MKRARKKRATKRTRRSQALAVPAPQVIPPEPPRVMTGDDARGRRRAYVQAPIEPETVEAVERFVDAFGGLFGALERELRRFSRRR